MVNILYAIVPVFLIIGAGFAAERIKLLPAAMGASLNAYAIRLALPVLLIYIISTATPAEIFQWKLWLGVILAHVIVYAGCYYADLLVIKRGRPPAVTSALAGSGSMGAFVGIPIIMNLLPGNKQALLVAGIVAVVPSLFVAVGQVQMEMCGKQRGSNIFFVFIKAVFANPLIIGVLIGLVLCLLEVGLWQPLRQAAALVGATAAPCALVALGVNIKSQMKTAGQAENKIRYQSFIVLSKLLALPLITLGILLALGVSGLALLVSVVILGTGVGIGPYIVAEQHKANAEQCALSILLTNMFSLATVAFFAYVLINALPGIYIAD